jgi:hypothetical protein
MIPRSSRLQLLLTSFCLQSRTWDAQVGPFLELLLLDLGKNLNRTEYALRNACLEIGEGCVETDTPINEAVRVVYDTFFVQATKALNYRHERKVSGFDIGIYSVHSL